MSILEKLEGGGLLKQWVRAHLDYPYKDWCLIWPFGRNQGGYANVGREGTIVHRIMCAYRHGEPPAGKLDAAHECGNGHLGCVNPHHVVWKSHSDNLRDSYRGRRGGRRYKLTPDQVLEIRAMKGVARPADIAEQFGVTDVTIHQILAGKIWKHPRTNRHIFTVEELQRIRAAPQADGVAKAFAAEFGVHITAIQRIRSGHSYKWLSKTADPAAAYSQAESKSP
jgi:hypothetical protein